MDLDFNAPMYRDFNNLDDEDSDVEAYFEVDHEAQIALKQDTEPPKTSNVSPLKENPRTVPKNVVMGVQTLLRPGERPAGLRDVTNSPQAGLARARAPLKRTNALGSRDEPCPKQSRSDSGSDSPAATPATSQSADSGSGETEPSPAASSAGTSGAPASRIPTPARGRGRSVEAPARSSPRLAARRQTPGGGVARGRSVEAPARSSPRLAGRRQTPGGGVARGRSVEVPSRTSPRQPAAARRQTPVLSGRGAAAAGRRRSVSAAAAPPLPPRRPTPSAAAAGARRRTPQASPAAAAAAQPARRTPSTGGRRRSMSQNDAGRAASGPSKLVVSETPNVLRRGLQLRQAARVAAEAAVKQEQQDRLDSLRRQMADYKKKAAESKKQPVRARPAPVRPPTVPQPFHLHEDHRAATGGAARSADEFKSIAQMVEGFSRKTPPRFHTKPAGERPVSTSEAGAASPHVTIAHTPALMTRARTRSLNIPTREQLEQAEIEECKQHQIRARPVNRRVLEQTVGVPQKQARPTTAIEPFHLTEMPAKTNPAADETASAAPEFHARPAPRAILEAPQGVPARPPPAATRPQSPALQLKQRMAERRRQVQESAEESGRHVIRALPGPDLGVPFKPRMEHKATRPEPFSFETRDKQRQAEKERKIQQVLEEERRQRQFHAQLLPPLSPRGVPERRVPPATRTQPFQMPGQQQAAAAAAKRMKKLEEEEAAQRAAAEFHAQPCTVTRQEPFQPRPAQRGPTAPRSPQLHTDLRSSRRLSFEQRQKQREAELQAMQEEAERQKQLQEEEEAARRRREAVHRAHPVRRYRPVQIQPSSAPLTHPQSPNWHAGTSRASHRSE